MAVENYMQLKVKALPDNESFVRCVVGAFCVPLSPTLEEINDIKTAVSEAVTNSVIHGYPDAEGDIFVEAKISGNEVFITIADEGVGIPDVCKALEPFFTTRPEDERSGMGFTVMQAFTDNLEVLPNAPHGTIVRMKKTIHGK